jgi:predicted NBD/HSP70 family sugar kinase
MPDPVIAILEALADRQRVSRAELVQATGLSGATVARTIERLRRDGVVREHPLDAVGVGRPPRVVELDATSACVVGIDAGGRTLRAAVADLGGTIRGRVARPVRDRSTRPPRRRPRGSRRRPRQARPTARDPRSRPGSRGSWTIEEARPASPDCPAGLPRPAGTLGDRFGSGRHRQRRPAGGDGEASVGAAIGCRDVVFLSLGFGLGAGIIVDGRPVRGIAHAAGAIAYLAPGRLEDRASGRAIPIRYRAALERARRDDDAAGGQPAETGPGAVHDARVVVDLAAAGDRVASQVMTDVLADLGDLVVDVGALLDPEVIVIGGGLAEAGAAILAPLERRIDAALPYPPRIVASVLEDAAVLHGAVSMAVALARRRIAGLDQPARPASELATLSLF